MASKNLTDDDVNDDNFDALSAEYEIFAEVEIKNTASAWNNYNRAEKALINFGLAIAPADIRYALGAGVRRFVRMKEEFIEKILKLDVSSLPR